MPGCPILPGTSNLILTSPTLRCLSVIKGRFTPCTWWLCRHKMVRLSLLIFKLVLLVQLPFSSSSLASGAVCKRHPGQRALQKSKFYLFLPDLAPRWRLEQNTRQKIHAIHEVWHVCSVKVTLFYCFCYFHQMALVVPFPRHSLRDNVTGGVTYQTERIRRFYLEHIRAVKSARGLCARYLPSPIPFPHSLPT